jgi:hypothetical protein
MTLQELFESMQLVTQAYSGNGMFGKECLGVVCDGNMGMFISDVIAAIEDQKDTIDLQKSFRGMKIDSMGEDTILYFPNEFPIE